MFSDGHLDREVVLAALLQVHRVYGTVAARDLAQKLRGEPHRTHNDDD